MEEERVNYIIIREDFNARIGEEGGGEEDEWWVERNSNDKKINNRGRDLLEMVSSI